MKYNRKYLLALLLLAGCGPDERQGAAAQSLVTPNNFHIDTLFEKDGCTIYRFYDVGYYRHFARCGNKASVTSEYTENCGKGCTRRVITSTDTEGKP